MTEPLTIFTARKLADGEQKARTRQTLEDSKLHRDICRTDPVLLLENTILHAAAHGDYSVVFGRSLIWDNLLSEEEHNYGETTWTEKYTTGKLWWKKTEEIEHRESQAYKIMSDAVQDIMSELGKVLYNRGFRFDAYKSSERNEYIKYDIYW